MYGIDLNRDIKYLFASLLALDKKEYHVRRTCNFDVLLLVFDGVLRFSEDGIFYEIHPGEYHIQRRGSVQDGVIPSDSPKYLYVHFNAEWTSDSLIAKNGTYDYEYLKDDIEQLHALSYSDAPYIIKAAVFYRILTKLCKNDEDGGAGKKIAEFIIENYDQNISIDMLCERFSFSKNHIINVFKKTYGMTPNVYLNMLRIKKAEELLISTSESIENIALNCGYRNYSHFYRQFLRLNNISPDGFRKKIQREQLIPNTNTTPLKPSPHFPLINNSPQLTERKHSMAQTTVYLSSFTAPTDSERFSMAMEYLKHHPYTTLIVEPGTYTITDERAREIQRATMAGEYGRNPQRIIFRPDFEYTRGIYFHGHKGTKVIADGVTLVVDGFMEPISIRGCEDVEIRGFTVTHKRLPYSRGVVTAVTPPMGDSYRVEATVEFDEECEIKEASPMVIKIWPFNPDTKKKSRADNDIYARRFIDSRHITVPFDNGADIHPGTELYLGHTLHFRPAVLIENSKNVTLDSLTVNNQPGMGILGNRSENITLRGVRVVPIDGHNFSVNVDATHFSAIKGTLRLEDCTFRGHGDDMTNVHTYYQKIVRIEGDRVCYMQEKTPDGTHAQTLDYPDVGDTLELYDIDSLNLIDTYTAVDVRPMPGEWMCRVELDHPLPENALGLIMSDVTWVPKTEIVGCHVSSHNARSLLIKSRDVLVENNTFEAVTGPAIVVSPEANWYEGVASRDVTIRGNRIIECAEKWYGDPAAIMVFTGAEHPSGQTMSNIVIEDNIIDCPKTPHGISVKNVDGLTVRRNKIVSNNEPVLISDSINVCFEPEE